MNLVVSKYKISFQTLRSILKLIQSLPLLNKVNWRKVFFLFISESTVLLHILSLAKCFIMLKMFEFTSLSGKLQLTSLPFANLFKIPNLTSHSNLLVC